MVDRIQLAVNINDLKQYLIGSAVVRKLDQTLLAELS